MAPYAVVLPESQLNSSEMLGYVVIRGLDTCKDGTIRSCLKRLGGAWISMQPFGETCEDAAFRNLLQTTTIIIRCEDNGSVCYDGTILLREHWKLLLCTYAYHRPLVGVKSLPVND